MDIHKCTVTVRFKNIWLALLRSFRWEQVTKKVIFWKALKITDLLGFLKFVYSLSNRPRGSLNFTGSFRWWEQVAKKVIFWKVLKIADLLPNQ